MIELRDVEYRYPRGGFCLRVPYLAVPAGQHVAVIGPSGSGKTTLLHLLAGIFVPEMGVVQVGDTNLAVLPDSARREFRLRQVGQVFQDFELMEYLNVHENIVLPYLVSRSLSLTREVWRSAGQLAESLGMHDLLRRPVMQLSQGEKQRVAICRALLPGPGYLLADEPTGNLDPESKERIMSLLRESARTRSATLIVVTHDRTLTAEFDRVLDFGGLAESRLKPAARLGESG